MAEENEEQPETDETADVAVEEPPVAEDEGAKAAEAPAEGATEAATEPVAQSKSAKIIQIIKPHWKLLGIAVSVLVLASIYLLTPSGPPEKTPKQKLAEALEALENYQDKKSLVKAQKQALLLKKDDYQDPDFPGALYFIFGIVTFRNAEDMTGESQDKQLLSASRYLKEAERRAIDQEHRPEWCYALGVCQNLLGSTRQSRPLLEEAIQTYPPGKLKASMLLTDIYLDSKSESELQKAFDLNTAALQIKDLDDETLDQLYLQRAQIFLALGKNEEAQKVLLQVKEKESVNQVTVVFKAQTLMAEGKYEEALKILAPVKDNLGLERKFSRQASYLMGLCAESLHDDEAAIGFYEQTTHRYEGTHEGQAAFLHLAELLRKNGRTEEAMIAYRKALKSIDNPDEFRNRWISLERVQQYVLDAWNAWVDEDNIKDGVTFFNAAIQLSDYLPPVIPEVQAKELAANANRRWAEYLNRVYKEATVTEQNSMRSNLNERWRQSGIAFFELARRMTTSDRYGEILSTSAEHFFKGRDYETALNVLTRFINTNPDKQMPQALVRRGMILLELDRLDEAIDHFQRVMTNYPTDVASFEARYLLGVTLLEKNELESAETVWTGILEASNLNPKAKQWSDALFSLGKLNFHQGKIADSQKAEEQQGDAEEKQSPVKKKNRYYEEATKRLREYVDRYPNSDNIHEARYLLARSLQNMADQPLREMKDAKTDNAREELKRKQFAYLKMAYDQFLLLSRELRRLESLDRLDELGKSLLKSTSFGMAHMLYLTEDYEEAIKYYHDAVNRYPQCTEVLIAYMKMSGCYESLGKKNEAKSMLEQAKIILKQMPDSVFESKATNLGREEWNRWLDWSRELRDSNQPVNQL